jgi:Ca2+:H+ antiporter
MKLRAAHGIYLLLMFVPLTVAAKLLHFSDIAQFGCAALGIIPLSALIGRATESLSDRLGPQWGGLINATFGNFTELIIGIFALHSGLVELVRASIIGSILGNVLLVLGACAFAGGLKYKTQEFSQDLAQTNAITLMLAVVAIVVPALFVNSYHTTTVGDFNPVMQLSVGIAALLLIFYFASLFFSLSTHRDLLQPFEPLPCSDEAGPAPWSVGKCLGVLLVTAGVVSFQSDVLVDSVKSAAVAAHMNQVFVGIIIVPIIGNAAEHFSAVGLALRNKMDTALSIALGSSIQVAMFVAPFLVIISMFLGHHLSMVFHTPEMVSLALATVIAAFIASDGKTHWLEGAQLLAAYAIIAGAFYFLPAN